MSIAFLQSDTPGTGPALSHLVNWQRKTHVGHNTGNVRHTLDTTLAAGLALPTQQSDGLCPHLLQVLPCPHSSLTDCVHTVACRVVLTPRAFHAATRDRVQFTHSQTHLCSRARTDIYSHICARARAHTDTHTHTRARTHTYVHTDVRTRAYTLHTNKQSHTHTHIHTHTHTQHTRTHNTHTHTHTHTLARACVHSFGQALVNSKGNPVKNSQH